MIDIKGNKEFFCTLLRMTKRKGIENVIKNLEFWKCNHHLTAAI